MDIQTVLSNACSPNQQLRLQAEAQLKQAEETQTEGYVGALCTFLVNPQSPAQLRVQAVLQLKNVLHGRSPLTQRHKSARWLACSAQFRGQVKAALLHLLQDADSTFTRMVAIAVAKLGEVELSGGQQWPELLENLVGLAQLTTQDAAQAPRIQKLQQTGLQCMGYLCEGLDETGMDLGQNETNRILTAIIFCMDNQHTTAVRMTATLALHNSLIFARSNMERKAERDQIIGKILEACQLHMQGDADVKRTRQIGFQCLCTLAAEYYAYIVEHMKAIYQITLHAIQNDEEDVAIQAVEFWNSLCEVEEELSSELREGGQPTMQLQNYIRGAISQLLPVVYQSMCKQESMNDEDADTNCIAVVASACMELCASAIGNEILQQPFMKSTILPNLSSQDWRLRDASTYTFGAIMEGVDSQHIGPSIVQVTPHLLNLMNQDPVDRIRGTATWSLSQVCKYHAECVPPQHNDLLMQTVLQKLSDKPGICAMACSTLHAIAYSRAESNELPTNFLSKYFVAVMQTLTRVTGRPDHAEHSLRMTAHEAMNLWIENSALDSKPVVVQLLGAMLQRLESTFKMSPQDRQDLQPKITATLVHILNRIDANDIQIPQTTDRVMQYALQAMSSGDAAQTSVSEKECILLIMSVVQLCGPQFQRYMQNVLPIIRRDMQNKAEPDVCACAIGALADITTALGAAIQPYCNDLIMQLVAILKDQDMDKKVKPPVFSAFADIAAALQAGFEPYLKHVMGMMQEAAIIDVDAADYDMLDWVSDLRDEIFAAYTCILQGLGEDPNFGNQKLQSLIPFLQSIFVVLNKVAQTEQRNAVIKQATGFIGDLADFLGPQLKHLLMQHQAAVNALLSKCNACQDDAMYQQMAGYAMQKVQAAMR